MQPGVVAHTASNKHVVSPRGSVNAANQAHGRAASSMAGHLASGDRAFVERAANGPIYRVTPSLVASALYQDRTHAPHDETPPLGVTDFENALASLRQAGQGESPAAQALTHALHNLKAQQPETERLDTYL